jgi:hypothetical protein
MLNDAKEAKDTGLVQAVKVETISRVTCLYWLESSKLVAAGFSCGSIIVYRADTKITPIEFVEKLSVKVHNRPLTGIAVDIEKRLLYSVSEGRKLRTISMEDGKILNGSPLL